MRSKHFIGTPPTGARRLSSRRALRGGRSALACLAVCATLGLAPAQAAESIEGVRFERTITAGDVQLELNAVGLLRYMVFIKAYVAGLYLGPGVGPAQVLDDVPRRLEIEYFYAIDKEDFASSTIEAIRRNVGDESFTELAQQVQDFAALYRSVEPGDRYSMTYLPGNGTELALNGERLGVIPGAAFGSAVFSIWFGPQEIDSDLKESLLKKRS